MDGRGGEAPNGGDAAWRRQSGGRHAGDAAPRTRSERPPTAGRECSARRRTQRAAPREPRVGRYARGMTRSCRADPQRPARPNEQQARHPGSGGCRADRRARARRRPRPGARERERLAEALLRGARGGVTCRTWGEGTPGRRDTVRLRWGATCVTGRDREPPGGHREAEFGTGGRHPVAKPKVLGGLRVGEVQGQTGKVLRDGEGGKVLGVCAKYCASIGVYNVQACCASGGVGTIGGHVTMQ